MTTGGRLLRLFFFPLRLLRLQIVVIGVSKLSWQPFFASALVKSHTQILVPLDNGQVVCDYQTDDRRSSQLALLPTGGLRKSSNHS